ncbi:MAG: PilZ domain-containing protein, partial [Lachnospiraceae bacterium]|nr:PilZ domain-containing protein [Lachnospiraceae bacterium]
MYLWEIPKTDNIIISFFLSGRKFNFTTSIEPKEREEKDGIYIPPIIVAGSVLNLDSRCENFAVLYTNQASGRTHIWNRVEVRHEFGDRERYAILSEDESVPENRRGAVRIPVGIQADCTISLLSGKYPCYINDISVTGIGANVDVKLAEKNLMHRLIYTHFTDSILGKTFYIKGRILHVTIQKDGSARCGCEILTITPSINEYINLKQTYRLARATQFEKVRTEAQAARMLLEEDKRPPEEEKPNYIWNSKY